MSSQLVVAALLALPVLAAPGAITPETLAAALGEKGGREPWMLVVWPYDPVLYLGDADDELLRLRADRDLAVRTVAPGFAAHTLREAGFQSPQRLLVSRDYKTVRALPAGPGAPLGAAILEFLGTMSYRTVWEEREAFIRDHPDHGEALDVRLGVSLDLAEGRLRVLATRARVGARATGSDMDLAFRDVADTLEALVKLPDWWLFPHLPAFCAALERWDAGASPRLLGILAGMRGPLRDAWNQRPHTGAGTLGTLWISLERCLEGRVAALPALIPAPGDIWPRRADLELNVKYLWAKADWDGLSAFLEAVPAAIPDAGAGEKGWKAFLDRQSFAKLLATVAQARLGQWKDAEVTALECRRWSGAAWPGVALALRDGLGRDCTEDLDVILDMPASTEDLLPPKEEPLQLVSAAGDKILEGLRASSSFVLWGTDELQWRSASRKELEVLGTWGGAWRWAAFRGPASLLATGVDGARPEAVAGELMAMAPPALSRLGAFIARSPDHLDARRKRADLLRARMPCAPLEAFLAEDVTAAGLPVVYSRDGGWAPDPVVWNLPVSLALPGVEAALRRWPGSAALWRAWCSWAPLLPAPRSVADFARSVEVLGPRSQWSCRLPLEVHDAVAAELLGRARWEEAAGWFQDAWNGLLEGVESLPPEDALERVERIHRHLSRALTGLRPLGSQLELEIERKNLLARLRPPTKSGSPSQEPKPFERLTGLPETPAWRKF